MGEYYGNWRELNNQVSNSFYNDKIDYWEKRLYGKNKDFVRS